MEESWPTTGIIITHTGSNFLNAWDIEIEDSSIGLMARESNDGPPLADVAYDEADYAGVNARLQVFRDEADGSDVIYYRNHGGKRSWDGTLENGDFPVDSGGTNPFVFANACLTGQYHSTTCLAEKFLQSGAAAYIGSTEVSMRSANNYACEKYMMNWVGNNVPVGTALKHTKRQVMDAVTGNGPKRLWVLEYNLYGDPAYASCGYGSLSEPAAALQPGCQLPEPLGTDSISVTLPSYVVEPAGETQRAFIPGPGGHLLQEDGYPEVPFYVVTRTYPSGIRIQDVSLITRTDMITDTGLVLPIVESVPDGVASPLDFAGYDQTEWYPADVFDWRTVNQPGGGTRLVMRLYPFYYQASTTNVRFYQGYQIDVAYETSDVQIESLATDQPAYPQGSEIPLQIELRNDGAPEDVVISAVVRRTPQGETIDGLILQALEAYSGTATFEPTWDSSGMAPGHYLFDVAVRRSDHSLLDEQLLGFELGIETVTVTQFTAEPLTFEPGDPVTLTIAISNTGTVPVTGTARINLRGPNQTLYDVYTETVTALPVGQDQMVQHVWDSSGVPRGACVAVGQVFYGGGSTDPRVADLHTFRKRYLPLVFND